MEYEIREMTPQDVPQAAALEAQIFSQPWSEKGFLDTLHSQDALYLTVWGEGNLLAYCGFLQSFETADIMNVAVREEYRRRGIAYAMLAELMNRGRQRGIKRYTLEVRAGNTAALQLYARLGFESAGIRKNFYEKPREDAVILWTR